MSPTPDQNSAITPPPPPADLNRRTILQGAAWTIPAIAVATVAPSASASTANCPVLPPPSAWALTTFGTLSADGTTGATTTQFISQKDAQLNTGDAGVTFSTSIAVVAGTIYTLTFQVAAAYANGGGVRDTSAQGLDVYAGSDRLFHSWTRARSGFALLPVSGTDTITLAFVASSTQSLSLQFVFSLQPRYTGNAGNDDIYVTSPTLLCS